MTKFTIGNKLALLRAVLRKFYQVGEMSRAIRQLNLMLLKTIGGKYADSFSRWKTIPEKSELGHIPQVSRFFVKS